MLGVLINFGDNFATSTLEVSGTIIGDLSPYLVLILGVILAVVIVSVLIRSILKH